MSATSLSEKEKREIPRHGIAVRVLLRDHHPPLHATTRDLNLRGMQVITATRPLRTGRRCTAEIEIDPHDRRWTPPLAVRVVWSEQTAAGVEFEDLPPNVSDMLSGLLAEARARRQHPRHRHNRL